MKRRALPAPIIRFPLETDEANRVRKAAIARAKEQEAARSKTKPPALPNK